MFVRPAVSPATRLIRALDRDNLALACEAAKECQHVRLEDSLRLCLLMHREHDQRFEPAAVRWLGKLLAEHPGIGLDLARQALAGMSDLAGTAFDVGGGELAVVLRAVKEPRAAEVLER
jgi:hypothetical protein